MALQLVPVGSYWIWANPLAGLAVIEPDLLLDWSSICACSPFGGVVDGDLQPVARSS